MSEMASHNAVHRGLVARIELGVMAGGSPGEVQINKASISSEGSFVHEDQTFGSKCSAVETNFTYLGQRYWRSSSWLYQ